jgi:hypothetical protein
MNLKAHRGSVSLSTAWSIHQTLLHLSVTYLLIFVSPDAEILQRLHNCLHLSITFLFCFLANCSMHAQCKSWSSATRGDGTQETAFTPPCFSVFRVFILSDLKA